jgi:hypothetical protein
MYTACLICIHNAFHTIVLSTYTSTHAYVILIIGHYYTYDNTFRHKGSLRQVLINISLYLYHETFTVSIKQHIYLLLVKMAYKSNMFQPN